MKDALPPKVDLSNLDAVRAENEELRAQLDEAQETLRAIREGEVDAIVVAGTQGEQIYSLSGAESVYRLIVQTMQEAAVVVNPDGTILSCNPQFEVLIRFPAAGIIGRPLEAFVAPEARAAFPALLARSLEAPIRQRLVFRTADGAPVPAHVSAQALQQPGGTSICFVATDLSALESSLETLRKLREQEEQLLASEAVARERAEELAAYLEAVPAITLLAHDPDCRRMTGTRATYQLLRLPSGVNVSLSAPDGERPAGFRILYAGRELALRDRALPLQQAAATGREIRDTELTLAFDDGTRCDLFGHAVPLFDAAGKVRGAVGAFVDVTARKQAEAALRESHATLEQRVATRTAELFRVAAQASDQATKIRNLAAELTLVEQRERVRLAGVLHDGLQQLLVAAKLRVNLLERGPDPAVRQSSQEIGRLLEEAIADSRSLTAELSPPMLRTGGLRAALEWLARWCQGTHHLTVQLEAPAAPLLPVPEHLGILIFQAARELLFNVVKYAGVSEATMAVACDARGLTLTVADAGAGFDPTGLRGEGGEGGGFGLATIRHRIELLGGCMHIASAPGQGTRVTLAVLVQPAGPPAGPPAPLEPPGSPQPAETPAPESPRLIRILLVDDHQIFREALAQLLRDEPDLAVVGEAGTGTAAVALVRRLVPDVVIMDINMPEMNGIEATRAIHAAFPDIRVIGLSVFDPADQRPAMEAAGAVAKLSKMGPAEALLAAIRAGR